MQTEAAPASRSSGDSRLSVEPAPPSLSMLPPPPVPVRLRFYDDLLGLLEHLGAIGRMK